MPEISGLVPSATASMPTCPILHWRKQETFWLGFWDGSLEGLKISTRRSQYRQAAPDMLACLPFLADAVMPT
mgnify:CR=1 FL=1